MRKRRPRKRLPAGYAPAIIVAVTLFAGGWLLIRRSEAKAPTSLVLEGYIAAGRDGDCARAWSHLSSRTHVLMRSIRETPMSEEDAIKQFCSYSPGTSDLEMFVRGSARTERVQGTRATAVAKYKYDRFFGFFGEGTATQRFDLVSEKGSWKIDYSDELDPDSTINMDEEAMHLVHQGWLAERSFFKENDFMTTQPAHIQGQLPGYPFGPIVVGVASPSSRRGTLYVAVPSKEVVCVSTRSGSGTIVVLKMIEGPQKGSTFQYGSVPRSCDKRPLARSYPGYSARIIYQR